MSMPARRLAPRIAPVWVGATLRQGRLGTWVMSRGWVALLMAVSLAAWALPTPWPMIHFGGLWVLMLVVPGLALTALLFGLGRFTFIELVPISFCLSLLLLAVPGTVAYLLRLSLDGSAVLCLSVAAVAVIAGLLPRRRAAGPEYVGEREWRSNTLLAILMALVSALAYRYAGYSFTDKLTDVWFHLSFVRKLYEFGVADPVNPFLKGEGVEFIYGYNLWHLLLALFARWLSADPLEVWAYAVPFVAFTFLCSLFPLARALFGYRLALTASFLYLVVHAVLGLMDSLIFSPKPSSIAIWVFSPVVLAFFIHYVSGQGTLFLWVAALMNVVPAALHFIEPMGVLLALGLLLVGVWIWSENYDEKARIARGLAVMAAVFLMVFALKLPFFHGQSSRLSEYAAQHVIRLWPGLLMNNPFNSELRQPMQIAVLLLMPFLFGWVRNHLAIQLLVFVPLFYFVVQYNPVFATLMSAVSGEVFVRKGISFLRILNTISLAVIVSHYLPMAIAGVRSRWRREHMTLPRLRGVASFVLVGAALMAAVAYFAHFLPALVSFAHTKLAVPERHALKGFFVGPVGMLAFSVAAVLLAIELFHPWAGRVFRQMGGERPDCAGRAPLFVTAALSILLLLLVAPLLDRRYTRPYGDGPYPRDLASVMPGEYRFLREALGKPAVVLVKPRDQAFDQETGAFHLQAFTKHYAVSLPDPDYKKTRSDIDYRQRFEEVKHVYSGNARLDVIVEMVKRYDVEYIVASRRDRSQALFEQLIHAPDIFPPVYQLDGVGVFKVSVVD